MTDFLERCWDMEFGIWEPGCVVRFFLSAGPSPPAARRQPTGACLPSAFFRIEALLLRRFFSFLAPA